jgi:hypothetical protein
MINMPKIVKAERDLTGRLAIKFEDVDPGAKEKEFTKAFSELRGGISWPIRSVPGYFCVLGLFAGTKFGTENSTMLVYEQQFGNALELMTDAYNKAHDLRFQVFYSHCSRPDWMGFVNEFERKIRGGLGGRDIRLKDSPFPNDFVLGKDIIKRLAGQKAFALPTASLLRHQLTDIRPADLDADCPEYKFPAVNAFRYLVVAWERASWAQRIGAGEERQISPLGWS